MKLAPELRNAVETVLPSHGSSRRGIREVRAVSGGSIHRTAVATLEDGEQIFLKFQSGGGEEMFREEARGLKALAAVGVVRVPGSVLTGQDPAGRWSFLVEEAIESGSRGPNFWERFGGALARMHRQGAGDRFGFEADNFLGSTPQPNGWTEDWCTFWRQRRLGFQLDLARRQGRSDPELDRLGDRLLDRLEEWLGVHAEPPTLIHGDLWGGNYLVDTRGESVLIDPAVYYGHREAELAMTRLFGGFEARFHRAYEEEWPLEPGAAERGALYELYHLLNHLNLFGSSYRGGCIERLRRLL